MATDRKSVTVYLPDNLVEYVTQYCTSNEVIGKNKDGDIVPRLATGIVELLKIVSATPVDELSSNDRFDRSELVTIKKQLATIEDRLTTLESRTSNVKSKAPVIESTNNEINKVNNFKGTSKVLNKNNTSNALEKIEDPRIVEEETAQLEEIEVKDTFFIHETENKPLTDDWSGAKTYEDSKAKIEELHLKGKTNGEIARFLNDELYPTFKGSTGKWRSNQIKSILK